MRRLICCLILFSSCMPCFAQSQAEAVHLQASNFGDMVPIQRDDTQQLRLVRLTSTEIPDAVRQACYSVGRVTLDQGNSSQQGSATYVGAGLWLTNRHVVQGNGGRYSVQLKSGQSIDAKVVSISRSGADLAVVETVDLDETITPIVISDLQPTPGMTVYPSGFDFGRLDRHVCWPARIVNFFDDGDIESVGTGPRLGSISGNSGGPTFTATGQLLAPLYGNGGQGDNVTRTGQGTCITVDWFATRTYLLPWRERIMRSLTGRGCYGGQSQCQPQYQPQPQYRPQPMQPQGPPPQYIIPPTPQPQILPQPQPQSPPTYQPQTNAPQPTPAPAQPQVTTGPAGPKGDQGPQGAPGPKGEPGEITQQHLAIIADKVREALAADPAMRGPAGPAGQSATVDTEAIVQEVLRRMPNMRVVLVDGSTKKIIDDETYKPGEALVFDINKLIKSR